MTTLILGFEDSDTLEHLQEKASREYLEESSIYCIECGGSGEINLGNFDHHDTSLPLPPACVQACNFKKIESPALLTLVRYVASVDCGHSPQSFPTKELSLSNLFSGMRLVYPDPKTQFCAGLKIFKTLLAHGIDPWGPMPALPEWKPYREAKNNQREALSHLRCINFFYTRSGEKAGYLETSLPGVHGFLRTQGCRVTIAYGLSRTATRGFCTIAGHNLKISPLLPFLKKVEEGWGGPAHGYIIASPRIGTKLAKEEIIEFVCRGI